MLKFMYKIKKAQNRNSALFTIYFNFQITTEDQQQPKLYQLRFL